uniref:Copia protein n=1 Tax=Rhizophora mucronata TaxID=61149 RepID=A0A2P2MWQ7_RHIMU
MKLHFIREAQENGDVNLTYYNAKDQMASILTKCLQRPRFKELTRKLDLQNYGTKERRS